MAKTYEIDATNRIMGRMATEIADLLRGKNLPDYQPNIIPDVEVVIINLDKLRFTGKKFTDKKYYKYSGYPGGMKTRTLQQLWIKSPQQVLRMAVYRMLPVNRSRDKIIANLHYK